MTQMADKTARAMYVRGPHLYEPFAHMPQKGKTELIYGIKRFAGVGPRYILDPRMVDTDTMSRFPRLTEMEEFLDECLLLLVEFLTSLPSFSPLANLAGMHLAGNTHDTFNKTTQEDWTRFRLAVQNTIDEMRLRLDQQAKALGAHSSQD